MLYCLREVEFFMNTKRITRTALLIAMLVAVQYATKSLGQIVTGSCVNLILAVTALVCDVWCGSVVALISPFCAFLLGIGTPILRLVPAIALGNLVFVLLLSIRRSGRKREMLRVVPAAVCKFLLLWALIVKLLLPAMGLPAEKVAALSAAFSYPQLLTALLGGVLALLIVPAIRAALDE